MKKVPLHLARPADVLAEPVTLPGGQVLLAEGTALTRNHLEVLAGRGVVVLVLRGDAAAHRTATGAATATGGATSTDAATAPGTAAERGVVSESGAPLAPRELAQTRRLILAQAERFGDTRGNPVMEALLRAVLRRQGLIGAEKEIS